jgi:hypothetical protein
VIIFFNYNSDEFQIGFTTEAAGRASDVALVSRVPIISVNGEQPEVGPSNVTPCMLIHGIEVILIDHSILYGCDKLLIGCDKWAQNQKQVS